MIEPSFFLVGAPKCGTTAMHEYFRQHPELFVPERRKDLPFFGTDLHRSRPRETLDEYLAYYVDARPEQRAGESCVWYLNSPAATHEIKEFSSDATILIMLRNPVELAYSQHSQLVYSHDEDLLDFEEALDAEDDRKRGLRIPKATGYRPEEGLYYTELGRFSRHVKRYFDVFGRENVHVIVYDDFRADTAGVMQHVFSTLGVDAHWPIDFKIFNPNKVPRSDRLQAVLREPPSRLESLYSSVAPQRLHGRLIPYLVKLNTRHRARPPLAPHLQRRLEDEFRADVERLSELLGRDLTGWCCDRAAGAAEGPY